MNNKQPNVILIMTDQQRWDTLGVYGNKVIETINLDYLASEGTVFENAYTPSPSCVPARASLLSGMDPWNTGILGMGDSQPQMGVNFAHTLPGELANAGYHTQGVGKMHFYPQRALNGFHNTVLDESGRAYDTEFVSDYKQWFDANKTGAYGMVDHGMDWNDWQTRPYHAPEFLHPTNWTVNESIRFLKERDPSKPFFMKTSFARPHSPYDAPSYYFDLYERKKNVKKQVIGDWAHMHDVPEDAVHPDAWRGVRTQEQIDRARAGYYGSIHHIDHQIGRLITHLKQDDLFDNTLIIFTSDHGDMLGDHNLWRKTYAYEGSAHIPFIVKPPSSWKRKIDRVETPVLLQDIMPTILDAVGVTVPDTVDGISLVPLLNNEKIDREYVHGEHSTCYAEEQEMQYVTDGKMKYIWFPRIGSEQLFDLTNDPDECTDLATDETYLEELQQWRSRLVHILKPRNSGLTDGNCLVNQSGRPFHTSPKYKERMEEIHSN